MFDNCLYDLRLGRVKRVLDLGANMGLATLFFSSLFPDAEFACVEPFPLNLAGPRETFRLNGIRATVFEGVIGMETDEGELHLGCDPDMYSLTPAAASVATLRIQQFSVAQLLDKLGWDEIDLLKVDIEGYEKTLLHVNNGWLSRVRHIVGEGHGHVNYGIDAVTADLEPFGFQVSRKSFDAVNDLTIFEATRVGDAVIEPMLA